MSSILRLTDDVAQVLSRSLEVFRSEPIGGTSVVADCGPFIIMKRDEGAFINIADTEDVFRVYGVALRRPMDLDYLCFITDDCEVCFIIDSDDSYDSTPFECLEEGYVVGPDTSDWICERCCEGFPDPMCAEGGWVRTAYMDGYNIHSIQIHHGACIVMDVEGADITLGSSTYSVTAVEGYDAHGCMPGLHVITDEDIVFYFRTELSQQTSDSNGGEE